MFDLGKSLQAGWNNFVSTVLDTPVSNLDLESIVRNEGVQGAVSDMLNQGNITGERATSIQESFQRIANGGPINAGDGYNILRGMVQGAYRNPDGTPNGKMDPRLLSIMEGTLESLDPSSFTPTFKDGTWDFMKGIAKGVIWDVALRDPNLAKVLGNLSPEVVNDVLDAVLEGDLASAGQTAILAAILPYLMPDMLPDYYPWTCNAPWPYGTFRPPILTIKGEIVTSSTTDTNWPKGQRVVSTVLPSGVGTENVGYKGYMDVRLGGLRFEIPPSVASILPVAGGTTGQITPGAQAGISFRHVQNYATLLIPGGAPVYQSLGIQGQMIEFVGAFLGFDHLYLLNAELHGTQDAQGKVVDSYYSTQSPDPYYQSPSGNARGGAWAVSRAFQQKVEAGLPQDLEINSGLQKIHYKVIVTTMERVYQRDDRTYYRIQALAVGGKEVGGDSAKPDERKEFPKNETKKPNQVTKPKPATGTDETNKPQASTPQASTPQASTPQASTPQVTPTTKYLGVNPKMLEETQSKISQAKTAVNLFRNSVQDLRDKKDTIYAKRYQVNLDNASVKVKAARDALETFKSRANVGIDKKALQKAASDARMMDADLTAIERDLLDLRNRKV